MTRPRPDAGRLPIQAVLFDLDDTLLDRQETVHRFVRAQYRRWHHWLRHVPEATYAERFIALDAYGTRSKEDVYRQLIEEFGLSHLTWQALLDDYLTCRQADCVPLPSVQPTLTTLAASGLFLGIVTNGWAVVQTAGIEALGIKNMLGAIVISEQEGVRKPDPEIFRRAVARLAADPGRTVFVGDHPVADIKGARDAGLLTVWRRQPHWPPPTACDGVIDDLAELPALLTALAASSLRPG